MTNKFTLSQKELASKGQATAISGSGTATGSKTSATFPSA